MKTQITRYVAEAADAGRSICVFQTGGLVLINDGPVTSPRRDKRFLWGAWALVENSNGIVGGAALSLVTFSGTRGSTWLLQLGEGIQGSGSLVQLKHPMPVEYGVGALVRVGGLSTGDILQVGAIYD